MFRKFCLMTFVTLSLSSLACGNSPLLHHENASGDAPTDRHSVPNSAACPLELPKLGLCASLTWDSEPASDEENSAVLRFWDRATGTAAGPYRDASGDVGVMLWMPAMGHGSSPVQVLTQGQGIYKAQHIYFVMAGEWEIRVQVKQNHQLVEQASFTIKL